MYRCVEPVDWLPYIRRMVEAAEKSQEHVRGATEAEFVVGAVVYDAALMQLGVIAEAASRVPPSARDELGAVPWSDIRAVRNRIAHNYEGLDEESIWHTVTVKVPQLIEVLHGILTEHGEA
ncbi:MAG: DUF86 domain-containing protein [Acidimicrobiales bacterium]|nr:DUF86 domain-containing protein [Acidimicrobiales bacterium]